MPARAAAGPRSRPGGRACDAGRRPCDGASAQYGSDAIAGVMNFLLKDDRAGGSLELNTGAYRAGDGDAYQPRDPGSRRQRHRAVHLPGGRAPGRPAPRPRDLGQRHGGSGRRHRTVHPDRRLLPGRHLEPPRPVAELHPRGGRARPPPVRGHHLRAHPRLLPLSSSTTSRPGPAASTSSRPGPPRAWAATPSSASR